MKTVPLTFAQPPESLCILRLSAIGDVCHTLAVVRNIQHCWPQTRLTWVIGKVEAMLLGDIPGIRFVVVDKKGPKPKAQLQQALAGEVFDVLLHMQVSLRSNLLSKAIKAKVRLGFDKARAKDFHRWFITHQIAAKPRQHVLDGLFEFSHALGLPRHDLRWDIPIPPEAEQFAQGVVQAGRPCLLISPCSSQRANNFRNWSVENYIAVCQHVQSQYQAQVLITGGNTALERQYGEQIAAATKCQNLVAKTSLKQLLALIQAADVVLCPDSGPAHMATAVGTPVVGLYATSNRLRTGPYLSQEHVVDAYPQAVQQTFDKTVEELAWGKRVRDAEVMSLIEPERVVNKLDHLL